MPPRLAAAGKVPRIESILAAHKTWNSNFTSLCDHVRFNLRIPWRRTTVSSILHAHGVWKIRRRKGRRPDEKAARDSVETLGTGAQWSADGSPLSIVVDGVTYTVNALY